MRISNAEANPRKTPWNRRLEWAGWAAIAIYAIVRMVWLPGVEPTIRGVVHDSAYILQVAENVREGRGMVLDTNWLVFRHPDRLPLPFHNANPLFPLSIVAMAEMTGGDVLRAGFMVLGLSHAVLLAAVFWWAGCYKSSVSARMLIAVAAAFFPAVFRNSLVILPDLPCAALAVWSLALFAEGKSRGTAILAGAVWGLAWLTRSSVIITLPAILILVTFRFESRRSLVRMAIATIAAVLMATPWLVYKQRVWGSTFRSDAGYTMMQDYHAREFGGSVTRYWHSVELPESFGDVLREDPVHLASWIVVRIPRLVYSAGQQMFESDSIEVRRASVALLLVVACGFSWMFFRRFRDERYWKIFNLIVAWSALTATGVLLLAVRAESFELRYLILSWIGLGGGLMAGLVALLQPSGRKLSQSPAIVLAAAALALWVVVIPMFNLNLWRYYSATDDEMVRYFEAARGFTEDLGIQMPVVAGTLPYLFTYATKVPALSIPESDDAYLVDYMTRYGSRHVFLSRAEAEFWRPHWLAEDGPRPPLRRLSGLSDDFVLVELKGTSRIPD
jgi:4-amino-4-deoxy-L-arabinose transferase-like glycosyltransferase